MHKYIKLENAIIISARKKEIIGMKNIMRNANGLMGYVRYRLVLFKVLRCTFYFLEILWLK